MKFNKIKDERVIQVSSKIQSEAYFLVLFFLLTSVIIKSYVLDWSFSQYVVELGVITLSTVYIAVRSMMVGHNFMNSSKSRKIVKILGVLALCLIITIVNGIRNYSLYGKKYTGIFDGHFIAVLLFTFISAAILILAVFALLYWFDRKGQQRMERKINNEDEND